jgi:hypothetical protein
MRSGASRDLTELYNRQVISQKISVYSAAPCKVFFIVFLTLTFKF